MVAISSDTAWRWTSEGADGYTLEACEKDQVGTDIVLHIKADTEEIKEAVQEMKDKPGKRWDGIVEKAIWAVVAAVIAFLLARFGL